MRRYARWMLCVLAVLTLAAGCSKKEAAEETTATAEETTVESTEEVDLGEITKLGTYKGVEVTKMSTEVTDEELDARIQTILDMNPEYVEITDRPAQEGDVVNIDFVGMKDGEAFEGGTAEGYDLELGSGVFIDGFEDGLIGASKGAELSLNLTFPEDYASADLAGQAVVFDVTVNSIEEKRDAVLDENFVQRMSDFTTVEEFRDDTRADMEAEKVQQADTQLQNDALMAALENSEFEINPDAVEQQFQAQYSYYETMVQGYGMTMEDYVGMMGLELEEFETEMRNIAEDVIKQNLFMNAVAEAEKMEVADEDRQYVADLYGTDVETMESMYGQEALDEMAMQYKVANFIRDNAVVTE